MIKVKNTKILHFNKQHESMIENYDEYNIQSSVFRAWAGATGVAPPQFENKELVLDKLFTSD